MRAILKSASALLALVATAAVHTTVDARSALVVADTEVVSLAVNTTARVATQNVISATRGAFMTVHFAQFNIADGDKVIVRDVAGTTKYEYTGLGRGDTGLASGFFSSRVPGNQAVVEYLPASSGTSNGAFGYAIDKITRSTSGATTSKICGSSDQTRPAKCYVGNADAPKAYEKSRAVLRLLIDGGEACTGWLIGSEGYMLTNYHCLYSDERALNTDYEVDGEGASCSDECKSWGACRGTIIAMTAKLVAFNDVLDYALVRLNTIADLSKYGYFQLRTQGPTEGEQIYIPQHLRHWAKRIAVYDDDGSVARVRRIGTTACGGNYTVGYTADTDGGASGSPVVGASDNQVIALHRCGDQRKCENAGTDSRALLWHLKKKGIVLKDGVSDPTAEIPNGPWIPVDTATPSRAPPALTPACAPSGGSCGSAATGANCCATPGEYCQPWNPTYYQCRPAPAQCGPQQVDVDFFGDDIAVVRGILPAECCAKCADADGCKAYTFVNYNSDGRSACYLKKGRGKRRSVVGAVSAVVMNPKPDCSTPVGGSCGSSQGTTCCPPGSYCQPWNPRYYQCLALPAQCSQQATDVDFYGNDIRTVLGVSPSECCNQCHQTAGCKAYTFVNSNPGAPACYLKSDLGQRRALIGAVSGTLN